MSHGPRLWVRSSIFGRLIALLASFAFVALVACDRNSEKFVEGESPRPPDLDRIFPPSEGQPAGAAPTAPQRGAPPVAQAPPAAQPPGAEDGAAEPITGTISVAEELQASVAGQPTLFVVARPFGVEAGPPMAVVRIESPRFPVSFEIGPDDVMIPSMRFAGRIGISVRLDGDGNATSRQPGDLAGATKEPLEPGARDVSIVLDERL